MRSQSNVAPTNQATSTDSGRTVVRDYVHLRPQCHAPTTSGPRTVVRSVVRSSAFTAPRITRVNPAEGATGSSASRREDSRTAIDGDKVNLDVNTTRGATGGDR